MGAGSVVISPIVIDPKQHAPTRPARTTKAISSKRSHCKMEAYVWLMRLSCPASFTHVNLLIWWWVCEDKGGFQSRYKQTDSKVRSGGLAQDASVQGGWQCYSLPSVSQAEVQLCWVCRHEGVGSSPPCHKISIATFHINMAVCDGLPCLFVEIRFTQATQRHIKRMAVLLSDSPSVYHVSHFHVLLPQLEEQVLAKIQFAAPCWAIKLQITNRECIKCIFWNLHKHNYLFFLSEFPMDSPWKVTSVLFWGEQDGGVSVWWHCKWHGWHIIFCFGMLPKQQRNVMRAVGVSSLSLLWEDLTKTHISLPLFLCCHPRDKWACRKSPWQLCVLKRHTAYSRRHFIARYFNACFGDMFGKKRLGVGE